MLGVEGIESLVGRRAERLILVDNEVRKREVKILKIRNLKDMWVSSFVIYKKDRTLSDNAHMFLDTLRQRAETREGPKEGKRTRGAGHAA